MGADKTLPIRELSFLPNPSLCHFQLQYQDLLLSSLERVLPFHFLLICSFQFLYPQIHLPHPSYFWISILISSSQFIDFARLFQFGHNTLLNIIHFRLSSNEEFLRLHLLKCFFSIFPSLVHFAFSQIHLHHVIFKIFKVFFQKNHLILKLWRVVLKWIWLPHFFKKS